MKCQNCNNQTHFKAIKYPEQWALYDGDANFMELLAPEPIDLDQFVCYDCGCEDIK